MSSEVVNFLPPDDPLARQMAEYAAPLKRELAVAQADDQAAEVNLRDILAWSTGIQDKAESIMENNTPVTFDQGFRIAASLHSIPRRVVLGIDAALKASRWHQMIQTGAHYRAQHGRADYLQGLNNGALFNLLDLSCIKSKKHTLAGTGPEEWAPNGMSPDIIAVSGLAKAYPEAVPAAHQSFSGTYTQPVFDLLCKIGIIEDR